MHPSPTLTCRYGTTLTCPPSCPPPLPPLQLWDHCFTCGPDFLFYFLSSYLMHLRTNLLAMDTDYKLTMFLAGGPTIDTNKVGMRRGGGGGGGGLTVDTCNMCVVPVCVVGGHRAACLCVCVCMCVCWWFVGGMILTWVAWSRVAKNAWWQ